MRRAVSATAISLLATFTGACAPGVGAPGDVPSPPAGAESGVPTGSTASDGPAPVGVLVMAHGGSEAWDASVLAAVRPMDARAPTVVAFGMAEPSTLEQGLDSLASLGVERVAVVRLFVSGSSFYTQTAYLLGLSDQKPPFFMVHGRPASSTGISTGGGAASSASGGHHGGGHGGAADPAPIDHGLAIATHPEGLMGSPEVSRILVGRVAGVSESPPAESVLLVAHGMGREDENAALVASMETAADAIAARGHPTVHVSTLREDWPEARERAEREIRGFVADETGRGRSVIVVPYRLSGFGPYADVLEGLEYVPTEGLLPHEEIGAWLERTASEVVCREGWSSPIARCGATTH